MNRDQNHRGRGHRDEQQRGDAQRGDPKRGDTHRDEQGGRARFQSAWRDTFNPEPQWLREDRERLAPRGVEEDYGRSRGRYGAGDRGEGRGSYASSGREWGESDRQYWQNRHGGQRAQSGPERSEYPQRGDLSQSGQAGGYGAYGSDRDIEPDRGMRSRGPGQDHSTGFEPMGWDDQDFSARGQYDTFRVGTGMGVGVPRQGFGSTYGHAARSEESDYREGGYGAGWEDQSGRHFDSGGEREESRYGSRGGWDLGTRQREAGRPQERSFRGMGPQHYKRPDERIRDDVYERLTESHMVDARFVSVDVSEGNVTLTGTVTERRMRYAAEDLVEGVMGVSNINNQLQVQGNDKGKDKET